MKFHFLRRTRSRSTSPLRSRVRDGPETRDYRARFRNRSPTPLRSRSRSRSPDRKKIDRNDRTNEIPRPDRIDTSPGGTPTQDSNHGDIDMRLSTTSQSIQSVVAVASNISNNQTGNFQPKRRCRDFDGEYIPSSENFFLFMANRLSNRVIIQKSLFHIMAPINYWYHR